MPVAVTITSIVGLLFRKKSPICEIPESGLVAECHFKLVALGWWDLVAWLEL